MSKTLVEVNNLNLWMNDDGVYTHILKDISFSVKENQNLGIVGSSGAGKSMTMYALTNLLPPKRAKLEGEIIYHGEYDILKMKEKESRKFCSENTAIILQNSINALNPYRKIYDQLEETIRFHNKVSKAAAKDRIQEMMKIVGLSNDLDTLRKYPHQFSGGMRQRIAIALALESDAKLLIADEPTTSLDVVNQKRFVDFIKMIRAERGLSFLYISHNLGLVDALCEDVVVIKNGEIVERGRTKDVFSNPSHEYTKDLVNGTKQLLSM